MNNILDYEYRPINSRFRNLLPKLVFSIIALTMLNYAFITLIIPLAQMNVNQHYGNENIVLTFMFFSLTIFIFGFVNVRRNITNSFISFVFAFNFIYWLYKLSILECINCSIR